MNTTLATDQTANHQSREYIGSVSPKGMITIPQEARQLLNIAPKSQVVIRVSQDDLVVKPMPMSLEDTFGSMTPINQPEDFEELIKTAKEERAEHIISEMTQ
ncbi:MAG: AbrB/MazE/SpoVT family DNA-binding domain-containing protein [Anaerolineae bacterium]|nr:AbrB/MazE/SpoVT family DNA-binding domain-containing protein [Anaerolineae bacterium]